jgi:hypothetical protein
VLSQIFGDFGPFMTGMTLATGWWQVERWRGAVPAMELGLADEVLPPEVWEAVIVLNGDLGPDFPLGRGQTLGSGMFRVVALHYRGLREARRQVMAGRSGRLLDDPGRYAAVVRDVHRLTVRPIDQRPYLINVDGLRMPARGGAQWSIDGQVQLVRAVAPP